MPRESDTEGEDSDSEGGVPRRGPPTSNPRKDTFLKCMLHTLVNHRSLAPPVFPYHVKELDVKAHRHGPFYDDAGQRVSIQENKARCDNYEATQVFASGQLWRDVWLHQTKGVFSSDYTETGGGYLSTQLRRVFGPDLAKPKGANNLIYLGPHGYSHELIEGLQTFLRRKEFVQECDCMDGFRLQLFGHSKTAHERDQALAEVALLRAQNENLREFAEDEGWDLERLAGITTRVIGSCDPPDHPFAPIQLQSLPLEAPRQSPSLEGPSQRNKRQRTDVPGPPPAASRAPPAEDEPTGMAPAPSPASRLDSEEPTRPSGGLPESPAPASQTAVQPRTSAVPLADAPATSWMPPAPDPAKAVEEARGLSERSESRQTTAAALLRRINAAHRKMLSWKQQEHGQPSGRLVASAFCQELIRHADLGVFRESAVRMVIRELNEARKGVAEDVSRAALEKEGVEFAQAVASNDADGWMAPEEDEEEGPGSHEAE